MTSNYDYKHRIDIEEAVLGSILIDSKGEKDLLFKHGIDDPYYFKKEFHQEVYSCILECWKNNIKPDIITIGKFKHKFKKINSEESKNFDYYTIQLTQKISSSAHLEHHLLLLKQYVLYDYWNQRATEIYESNWNDRDVFIVSDNIIKGYQELEKKFVDGIKDNGNRVLENQRLKFEKIQKGEYFTVPTLISEFDEFTAGGFHPAELTIIAGRPGMGKTSITLSIAKNACYQKGKKGAFLSLEMPKVQLQNRVIAEITGIDYRRIKSLTITKQEFNEVERMYKWFDEQSSFKIYDRRDCPTLSSIEKLLTDNQFDFIVIDYLQLITLDGKVKSNVGNREQEISEISRSLKTFATSFDIPVIALSQLSRAVEARSNKRPILSDLRESGSLEQDADNVIFYYRDAYYRALLGQIVPEIEEGNFELIMAKGRENGTRKFDLHMDFRTGAIENYFLFNSDVPIPKVPPAPTIPPIPKKG